MTPEIKQDNSPTIQPQLLNRKQLATYISISPAKISRMQREKLIPAGMIVGCNSRRWNIDEIRAWIEAKCPSQAKWEQIKQ